MDQLPDRPSALIRLALADLEAVEQDPRYKVEMTSWHEPQTDESGESTGVCEVCLAGVVMARELGADPNDWKAPSYFNDGVDDKLRALDHFRRGDVSYGIKAMTGREDLTKYDSQHIPYKADARLFKEQMGQLADNLEREGL